MLDLQTSHTSQNSTQVTSAPSTMAAPAKSSLPPPVTAQTQQPAKPASGGFDLLGDLGSDPFASSTPATVSSSTGTAGLCLPLSLPLSYWLVQAQSQVTWTRAPNYLLFCEEQKHLKQDPDTQDSPPPPTPTFLSVTLLCHLIFTPYKYSLHHTYFITHHCHANILPNTNDHNKTGQLKANK